MRRLIIAALIIATSFTAQSAAVLAARSGMLAAGTPYATPYYINEGRADGPTVVIVGGMHGDEPAGYRAAQHFVDVTPKKGRLVVIPEANRRAIQANDRTGSHPGDLNRAFPRSSGEKPDTELARSIWELVVEVDPDFLFDLHEGYDFHKQNSKSVGQSIIYYPRGETASMAARMRDAVNAGIDRSSQEFVLLRNPVRGSLARAAGMLTGAVSMILETSKKQPLDVRVNQHVTMVNAALSRLGMR